MSFKTNYQILLRHVNFVFQTENSQNYCKAASKVYQILYSTPPFVSLFFSLYSTNGVTFIVLLKFGGEEGADRDKPPGQLPVRADKCKNS